MNVAAVETYETRTPDAEGWRGVPFRRPTDPVNPVDPVVPAQADGGQHDGGPMPPEAPRDPEPEGPEPEDGGKDDK